MGNLTRDISEVCKKILDKKTIQRFSTREKHHIAGRKAMDNENANQEVLLDNSQEFHYDNVKENIRFRLFKDLHITQFRNPTQEILEILRKKNRTFEEWKAGRRDRYDVVLQSGDIEICFSDSVISQKLSAGKKDERYGAIISGEDGFIECHERSYQPDHKIILATQDDLHAILEGLEKMI